jgi:hypothetical protein
LAWSEVKLNFLNEEFIDCQAMATETLTNSFCLRDATGNEILPTNKAQRRYGYKVYRSADNRMTWKDVTIPTSGLDNSSGSNLIYAKSFNYYKRPGQDKVTNESMAFFTDYSVESIAANPTTTARGRILWYKIVPYFDNKPITITNSQNISVTPPNVIKVILPPANMALVHRMMSNRQSCIELGRDDTSASSFKKDINYACDYNGFGAQPKGAPWKTDNSGIDLGGHLLVDRFELGCNYTRGDAQASTVSNGSSYYFRSGIFGGLTSWLTTFKGFATDTLGVDKSNNFQGCAAPKAQSWSFGGNTLEGLASNPFTVILFMVIV